MGDINPKWLELSVEGLLRSFSYIVGIEQLKMFVSKAGEAMMGVAEEKGAKPISGTTIPEVTVSVGESVKSMNPGEIDWNVNAAGDDTELSIGICPNANMCASMFSEIIAGGRIDKKKLPCIMAEIASGGCRMMNLKNRATLESFAPGVKCVSRITKMEV